MGKYFSVDDVKGQVIASKYIHEYLKSIYKIPPLMIFHGPDGVGKWMMAERLARHVLCIDANSCGVCPSCKSFMHNTHPDFIIFPADSRIPIGKEKDPEDFTIRWLINRRLYYKPHLSPYRIVLFPDASLINNEAETALLKSLEESPPHTRFIFLVSDLHKLRETIVSRGITIPFYHLNRNLIQEITANTKDIYYQDFFGGSINPYEIPYQVVETIKNKIEDSIGDPYLLLEFEKWIKDHKIHLAEWMESIVYKDLLELISTVLIYFYSRIDIIKNSDKIEEIYKFKEKLHLSTPGIEPYLLGKLFNQLCRV